MREVNSQRTHRMHCTDPWFSLLRAGTKVVEGRIHDAKWAQIRPGDRIEFHLDDQQFLALVVAIRAYPDVERYLEAEGLARALPGVKSLEGGVRVYYQFHTEQEYREAGMLALEVKVL